MTKQTFTTGQILTAAQMTSLQQTALLGGSASGKTASYVLVAADAGTAITMTSAGATTITVNTSLFAAGDIVTLLSLGAGVCTITAGTASVNTSGSLALSQYQGGVLYFTSTSAAVFFQFATPASGDISAVNAGVGISGGGSSGDVTITNSMATAIDAAGDLIYGTGDDAFTRLGIGTSGQVLTVSGGGIPSWAAASAGGMTLLSTTSLTTTTTTISIDSTSYVQLLIILRSVYASSNNTVLFMRFNSDTGNNYSYAEWRSYSGNTGDFQSQNNASYAEITNQLGTSSGANSLEGSINVFRPTDTSQIPFEFRAKNFNDSSQRSWYHGVGKYMASAAISGITLFNPSSAATLSGTVYIYGVK